MADILGKRLGQKQKQTAVTNSTPRPSRRLRRSQDYRPGECGHLMEDHRLTQREMRGDDLQPTVKQYM